MSVAVWNAPSLRAGAFVIALLAAAAWGEWLIVLGSRDPFTVLRALPVGPRALGWSRMAWGIAATYLLVAIQVTSWMMKRLPRRLWHSVHLLSLPMFVLTTVHGFTSGADNTNLAVQWLALTGGLLVFLLVTFRVLAPRRAARAASNKRLVPV